MALTITPLAETAGCTLGATVTGVALDRLSEPDWQRILTAFHEHAVLIFPAQHLDLGAQADFARRFGDIEVLVENRDTVAISNVDDDGRLIDEKAFFIRLIRGNEGWHTDSSYMPLAAKASVLSAQVVPPAGGETEWADARAAYTALDAERRARIEGLSAYHSIRYSQARLGHAVEGGAFYGFYDGEAPLRPLVKRHPVTGRPALYIGRHAHNIPGLDARASETLLDELLAFTCQPPRVHRHRWQPGDIAVWDNRCALHRALPYDYQQPRVMQHTRVRGEVATESALNVDAMRSAGCVARARLAVTCAGPGSVAR